jgi:hypothetical protein
MRIRDSGSCGGIAPESMIPSDLIQERGMKTAKPDNGSRNGFGQA